jgi:hypothetical protein
VSAGRARTSALSTWWSGCCCSRWNQGRWRRRMPSSPASSRPPVR